MVRKLGKSHFNDPQVPLEQSPLKGQCITKVTPIGAAPSAKADKQSLNMPLL